VSGSKHMDKYNKPLGLEDECNTCLQLQQMYTTPHGATLQRTVVFMLTAVIISILRPGRSRKDTKEWHFVSTERQWRTRHHCWRQQRRGRLTLDYTHQWHISSVTDQFPAPSRIREYLQLPTLQSKVSVMHLLTITDSNTAIFIPHCTSYKWQFINYSAQLFSDSARNVSHVTYRTFSAYLPSLWEWTLGFRLHEEMLLK
jgi:hypothetical protein